MPLFDDLPGQAPTPPASTGPWRRTAADAWTERTPPDEELEGGAPDVLRRDLEFLRALEIHGAGAAFGTRRFRELHEKLVGQLARWLERGPGHAPSARRALATIRELAELRGTILRRLNPDILRRVVAAEPRVKPGKREAEDALSLARFELAEARGDVIAIDLATADALDAAGLIGPHRIDGIVREHLESLKAEQERRPLPARAGLATLLKGLPVEWLDATWQALGLGPDAPSQRKERERAVCRHLEAPGTLLRIVSDKLSDDERALLAWLLERGGRAPLASVARRFGSDRGDGWFWDEEPPASVLGRVRLHGLAFVGMAGRSGSRRTVAVPRELWEGLEAALDAARSGDVRPGPSPAGVLPELAEALEDAFPDGRIEPTWYDREDDGHARHEDVRDALARLPGADFLYERSLEGYEEHEGFDPDDDFDPDDFGAGDFGAGWEEPERSYGLFFLSLKGPEFTHEIDTEYVDEEGEVHPTVGSVRIGLAVALSAVAPFALLRVTSMESDEEGGTGAPDIDRCFFDEAGNPSDGEEVFREMLEEEPRRRLDDLRRRIEEVLTAFGIAVLSKEELARPLPWLEADEGVLVADPSAVTVEDALFFRCF